MKQVGATAELKAVKGHRHHLLISDVQLKGVTAGPARMAQWLRIDL